jgi:hypothetical protein
MPFLGIPFNILPVIRSYPGAFFGFRSSCIMFLIAFGVRNLIGCNICSGSFSALLISVSRPSLCGRSYGLNVHSKCLANVFAFSLSLWAQVCPAFLICGMCCVSCFNRLVPFQSESSVSAVAVRS